MEIGKLTIFRSCRIRQSQFLLSNIQDIVSHAFAMNSGFFLSETTIERSDQATFCHKSACSENHERVAMCAVLREPRRIIKVFTVKLQQKKPLSITDYSPAFGALQEKGHLSPFSICRFRRFCPFKMKNRFMLGKAVKTNFSSTITYFGKLARFCREKTSKDLIRP